MLFTLRQALESLDSDAVFQIAREARPPSRYLFATLLPEMNKPTFDVKAGNLTIRPLMAGLVGTDSPYPETGHMTAATFLERSAKLASKATLTEEAQREILAIVQMLQIQGGNVPQQLVQDILNFVQAVLLQGHFDRTEWLRSKCLIEGEINWLFSGASLIVDYGIPAGNFLTHRTGNDYYGGSASKFWTDIRQQTVVLNRSVRARILNSTTLDLILANSVNTAEVLAEGNVYRIRRYLSIGGNTVPSSDARDTVELIVYDEEGEVPDPADATATIRVPFVPDGKILAIGNNSKTTFRPGQGSQDDPALARALGYTHIAPTVEGRGVMGRWARVYTPEERPYQLTGEAVANLLPVLEAPEKVAVASTAMS